MSAHGQESGGGAAGLILLVKKLIAVAMLLAANLAWAGNLDAADAAYDKGDFATAFRLAKTEADKGNSYAQLYLGILYNEGKGVTQDCKEAARWYKLAAEQGVAIAQRNLGARYAKGQGVLQDYVKAHMWANLAAMSGDKSAKLRDAIAKLMTPDQIAKAQKAARECLASNYKRCD